MASLLWRSNIIHLLKPCVIWCSRYLASRNGLITQGFPAKNVAADPVRNYEIAPKEIVRLMGELRERRLEFLGIYHSHPNWLDTNEPSPKDI